MEYKDLQEINKKLRTVDVKGKAYAEVNQRILGFRQLFPNGSIETELLSNNDGMCIIKATIKDGDHILATGLAYEKENSTFINKTSYIENCETSAVGRALGILGIGAETSVASAEEVQNAIVNQPLNKSQQQRIELELKETNTDLDELLAFINIDLVGTEIKDFTYGLAEKVITLLTKKASKK